MTAYIDNRRDYSRIDVYIPLTYRLVTDEETAYVRSRVSGEVMFADFKRMPALNGNPRWEWLNGINDKIDAIIRILTMEYEGFHSLPFKFVNISGSGMRFSTQQFLHIGDILEFKMLLNIQEPVALYVYGKVIHLERQTSGYFTTVVFCLMDDLIRDYIIQFTFEMEREALRSRQNEDNVFELI